MFIYICCLPKMLTYLFDHCKLAKRAITVELLGAIYDLVRKSLSGFGFIS